MPRGSVTVTAGGRVLVEGVDYTVNYQLGTVQILDPSLQSSNTPINVSVENNAVFGQQTKRFSGFNIEHEINENFQSFLILTRAIPSTRIFCDLSLIVVLILMILVDSLLSITSP